MADTITTTNILGVGLEYVDDETQRTRTTYLKLPNPKSDLTEQQIKAGVLTLIDGTEPILKDINGNAFNTETAIATSYFEDQEIIDMDIEN